MDRAHKVGKLFKKGGIDPFMNRKISCEPKRKHERSQSVELQAKSMLSTDINFARETLEKGATFDQDNSPQRTEEGGKEGQRAISYEPIARRADTVGGRYGARAAVEGPERLLPAGWMQEHLAVLKRKAKMAEFSPALRTGPVKEQISMWDVLCAHDTIKYEQEEEIKRQIRKLTMQQLKEELKGQMSEVDQKRKVDLEEKRKELEQMLRNVNDYKRDTEQEINVRKTRLRQQAMENKKKIDLDMVCELVLSPLLCRKRQRACGLRTAGLSILTSWSTCGSGGPK